MKKNISVFLLLIVISSLVYSQNFWFQTNGPNNGSITSICPISDGSILCGTITGGGLFRTTSQGSLWSKTYSVPDMYAVESIAQTPSGKIFATPYMPSPVIVSSDNGINWEVPLQSPPYSTSVVTTQNGFIFIGAKNRGVWKSTDNGNSWLASGNFSGSEDCNVYKDRIGNIYASCNWGFERSTDYGMTWTQVSNMLYSPVWAVDSTGTIFTGNYHGLFKSTNNGLNWSSLNNIQSSIGGLTIEPNGTIYCGTGNVIAKSSNNGNSWNKVLTIPNFTGNSVSSLVFSAGIIYAGIGGMGMFRSLDHGNTWERINTGILNSEVSCLAVTPGNLLFAATQDGIHLTTNKGQTWNQAGLQYYNVKSIATNLSGTIFASTSSYFANIMKSTNNGNNWDSVAPIQSYKLVTKEPSYIFAGTNNGVYRSSDNGVNWSISNFGNGYVYSLLVLRNGDILAGSVGIFRSTNNGLTWIRQDSVNIISNQTTFSIVQSVEGYLLSSSDKLYRSDNNGVNWSPISQNTFQDMIFTPSGFVLGIRSNWQGVMLSVDHGNNWNFINNGLIEKRPGVLALDSSGTIYMGSNGSSVFKTTESILTGNIVSTSVADSYLLYQNYPNPFNPVTQIKFDIPKTGFVKIVVYNILGKEIKTLMNEQLGLGTHEVQWDASNYPSGVYFYKLISGDFISTRKMVLIK